MQKISSIKEKIMENIIRQHYLNKVERYFGKNTIIVLTGQRRVGKSYLLKQLRDQKQNEANSNVIYIDKEKREFDSIQTYRELNDHIEHHYQKGKKNYIFIDMRFKTLRNLSAVLEATIQNPMQKLSLREATPKC